MADISESRGADLRKTIGLQVSGRSRAQSVVQAGWIEAIRQLLHQISYFPAEAFQAVATSAVDGVDPRRQAIALDWWRKDAIGRQAEPRISCQALVDGEYARFHSEHFFSSFAAQKVGAGSMRNAPVGNDGPIATERRHKAVATFWKAGQVNDVPVVREGFKQSVDRIRQVFGQADIVLQHEDGLRQDAGHDPFGDLEVAAPAADFTGGQWKLFELCRKAPAGLRSGFGLQYRESDPGPVQLMAHPLPPLPVVGKVDHHGAPLAQAGFRDRRTQRRFYIDSVQWTAQIDSIA